MNKRVIKLHSSYMGYNLTLPFCHILSLSTLTVFHKTDFKTLTY